MEEEEKNKGSIELDCDLLFSRRDDEPPPPILVVTPTIPAPERKRSPPTVGDDQQEQSQRRNVEEAINRQRRNFETFGLRLWDAGEKLRANRKRLEEEIERRRFRRVEKDDDGCKNLTQSKGPHFTK
ncbi:Ulp1 peptidase [Sarracenia purpurea var. burkii]